MLGERDQVATIVKESTLPYANLLETLALGLLVLSKHDYAESKHGVNYSNSQLANSDAFTSAELAKFREEAGNMLMQFAVLLAIPEPEPVEKPTLLERVKEWLWGFGQGYAAAIAWSLTLLGIAILVRYGGGDLIDIFAKWVKPQ